MLQKKVNPTAGIRLLIYSKVVLHRILFDINADSSDLVWFHWISRHQSPRFILGWPRTDLTLCHRWFAVTADTFHSAEIDHLHVILHMIIFSLNSIPHSLHVERSDALPPVVW